MSGIEDELESRTSTPIRLDGQVVATGAGKAPSPCTEKQSFLLVDPADQDPSSVTWFALPGGRGKLHYISVFRPGGAALVKEGQQIEATFSLAHFYTSFISTVELRSEGKLIAWYGDSQPAEIQFSLGEPVCRNKDDCSDDSQHELNAVSGGTSVVVPAGGSARLGGYEILNIRASRSIAQNCMDIIPETHIAAVLAAP